MRQIPLFLLLLPCLLTAQTPCGTYGGGRLIQPNRVAAWHSPTGTQFFDGHNSRIQIPHDVPDAPYVICALTPWLLARNEQGDTLTSTARFGYPHIAQWFAGPLGPDAAVYADACTQFDRLWSVSLADILAHQADWADNGQIDDTLSTVFGWPAEGNAWFSAAHGFSLPADHTGGWAEFADLNGNQRYDPDRGEYPCIHIAGQPWLPDEMHWLVMHDMGQAPGVSRHAVGMEVQLTVYGFYCQDDPILSHTLFHRYKLINPRATALDSVYFGLWFDADLGCGVDDMMGADTARATVFIYNRDSLDGDIDTLCSNANSTYGSYSPFQSITWLDRPMHAFGGLYPWPDTEKDYYPFAMLGRNPDGTPLTPAGTGHNPGDTLTPTRFLFPGDPRLAADWTMYDALDSFIRPQTGVTSIFLDRLAPGAVVQTDVAHAYHVDSTLALLENYPLMQDRVDLLRNALPSLLSACMRFPVCANSAECVWPGDFDRNGIVDPQDMLLWGAMRGAEGPARDGRIHWAGHAVEPWAEITNEGIGFEHGDADGNGKVDESDIALFEQHAGYLHAPQTLRDPYPAGDDLLIGTGEYTTTGIQNIYIQAGHSMDHVLGLSFELEVDTTLFDPDFLFITYAPDDEHVLLLQDMAFIADSAAGVNGVARYAYVFTDNQPRAIQAGYRFSRLFRLRQKEGVILPDSLTLRLRNLVAVDADGNNLNLGSRPVTLHMEITSASAPQDFPERTVLWPNPTAELIHLDTPRPGDAVLHDTQGRLVHTWTASDLAGPLSLQDLPAGLYFLKLRGTGEVLKVIRE
jgi:hypothetical protein